MSISLICLENERSHDRVGPHPPGYKSGLITVLVDDCVSVCQLRFRTGEKPPFFPHGSGILSLYSLALPIVSWQSISGPPSEVWASVFVAPAQQKAESVADPHLTCSTFSFSFLVCISGNISPVHSLFSTSLIPPFVTAVSQIRPHSIKVITILPPLLRNRSAITWTKAPCYGFILLLGLARAESGFPHTIVQPFKCFIQAT